MMSCSSIYHISLHSKHNNHLYTWLIDTGASISAIKYKHIAELNAPIQKGKLVVNGIGGKIEAIGFVS